MAGGGAAIGVIPKFFAQKVAHQGLTELHVVRFNACPKTDDF